MMRFEEEHRSLCIPINFECDFFLYSFHILIRQSQSTIIHNNNINNRKAWTPTEKCTLIYEPIYIFGVKICLCIIEMNGKVKWIYLESDWSKQENIISGEKSNRNPNRSNMHTNKSHTCASIDTRISCN